MKTVNNTVYTILASHVLILWYLSVISNPECQLPAQRCTPTQCPPDAPPPHPTAPMPVCTGAHLGQLLNLVGVQVELLQRALEAEDLLGHLLQAAVGVVQHGDDLLLASEAAAGHQPADDLPLGRHLQTLHCGGGEGKGKRGRDGREREREWERGRKTEERGDKGQSEW